MYHTSANPMSVRDEYFYRNLNDNFPHSTLMVDNKNKTSNGENKESRKTVLKKIHSNFAHLLMNTEFVKKADFRHARTSSGSRNHPVQSRFLLRELRR